jgi:hypothetical protein
MDENDCIVLMKSQFAYKGKKYMSHLHPNRNEVLAHPNYVFNKNKAIYLLESLKNKRSEDNITENFKHGEMESLTEEEEEVAEKINENKIQQKQEYLNNADVNGQQLIAVSQDLNNPDSDVMQKISNMDELEDSLMETTDESWGLENLEYGERPAN